MLQCLDVFHIVCLFLEDRDLLSLVNTSKDLRRVARYHISSAARQYLRGGVYVRDGIEIAPPSQIIALGFVSTQRKLVAVARHALMHIAQEPECVLYSQTAGGGASGEARYDLPSSFAVASSSVRFEGERFLVCTTHEGEILVFDCELECLVTVPGGCDAFQASPSGDRFLLDLDKHLLFFDTDMSIRRSWSLGLQRRGHSASSVDLLGCWPEAAAAPPPLVQHATFDTSKPIMRVPLGNSSAAWHSFWSGSSAVLYLHEGGADLYQVALGDQAPYKCFPVSDLADDSSALLHNARSAVTSSADGVDTFTLLSCKSRRLHVVRSHRNTGVTYDCLDLHSLLPLTVVVQSVHVAVPDRVFAVFTTATDSDKGSEVLLVCKDLSVSRRVRLREHPCYAFLTGHAAIVAANALQGGNPLLEAVEGGLGTIYSFAHPSHATTDEETAVVEIHAPAGMTKPQQQLFMALLRSASGVETLSWVALGIVSASLLWTVLTLCYHGWRFHIELLFWAKIA